MLQNNTLPLPEGGPGSETAPKISARDLDLTTAKAPDTPPSTEVAPAPAAIEAPSASSTVLPPPPPTNPRRFDPTGFPDCPAPGTSTLPLTIDNVAHLLRQSGITARFDVLKKRIDLRWTDGKPANTSDIVSLANVNRLNNTGWLLEFIHELAMRDPVNPVADWIRSTPWDGEDRLPALYATVETAEAYPSYLKAKLLYRWLLSAVAAVLLVGRRFHARGVLTLQGPQGIGKTTWIANLAPQGPLRNDFVKRDHHLDGANKDSILGAIAHWIVEIGELDSSFRKDVARLKGFLTGDCDKVRPPYGRTAVEYDRRTVFAATVNDEAFLVDNTGNSRFWTIAVERLEYDHGLDMQQVFAQLATKFEAGEQWWLTPDEEEALSRYNLRHRAVSAIRENILDHLDLDRTKAGEGDYKTASQILRDIGINRPSNAQAKECGATLRETLGPPSRVQGRDQWRVALNGSSIPHGY